VRKTLSKPAISDHKGPECVRMQGPLLERGRTQIPQGEKTYIKNLKDRMTQRKKKGFSGAHQNELR